MDAKFIQGSLKGARILLLEDNAFLSLVFEDMLRDAGCEISGPHRLLEAARTAARTEKLDAAIMDVRIQDDTSLDFAETLSNGGVPVILMSGYGAYTLPEKLRESFIQKPFDEAALLELLCRRLADKRSAAQDLSKPEDLAMNRRPLRNNA